jgi:hypothetical protein
VARGPARQHRADVRDGELSIATATGRGLSADAIVVRAAAVLGLVWLGDALIYVVLPLHAEVFGLGLGLVAAARPPRLGLRVRRPQRHHDRLRHRRRAGHRPVDSGLAVGPLVGGFVVARLGLPVLYDAVAAAIVGALVVHRLAGRRPLSVSDSRH